MHSSMAFTFLSFYTGVLINFKYISKVNASQVSMNSGPKFHSIETCIYFRPDFQRSANQPNFRWTIQVVISHRRLYLTLIEVIASSHKRFFFEAFQNCCFQNVEKFQNQIFLARFSMSQKNFANFLQETDISCKNLAFSLEEYCIMLQCLARKFPRILQVLCDKMTRKKWKWRKSLSCRVLW